eukprot:gene5273-6111_t
MYSNDEQGKINVAQQIRKECLLHGFFYIKGHGIDQKMFDRLESVTKRFFALPTDTKTLYRSPPGSKEWRGYFRLGDELTSLKPDQKEGLYYISDMDAKSVDRSTAARCAHETNPFPEDSVVDGMKDTVLDYVNVMTELGHTMMEAISLSLGLEPLYFADRYTSPNPFTTLGILNYPSRPAPQEGEEDVTKLWGTGEHTDYGVLTLLAQDDIGGLQVRVPGHGWIKAPPIANTFICNIGDMLEKMTGGLYRSTLHRVALNSTGRERHSFPFFFDPNFNSTVEAIPGLPHGEDDSATRWDKQSVHVFGATYGEYVLAKVGKALPDTVLLNKNMM